MQPLPSYEIQGRNTGSVPVVSSLRSLWHLVLVRLIAQDTIEQAVLDLHQEKRALARGLLEGADRAARLSTQELMNLIAYGSRAEN